MQKKNKTCDEISAQLVEWKQKYSTIQSYGTLIYFWKIMIVCYGYEKNIEN